MEVIWKIRFFHPFSSFFFPNLKIIFFNFGYFCVFQYKTRPKWSYYISKREMRSFWTCLVLENAKITKIEKNNFQIRGKKFENGRKNRIFQMTSIFSRPIHTPQNVDGEGPQNFFPKNWMSEVFRVWRKTFWKLISL